MVLKNGWYGLVLRVDDLTAEKACELGRMHAGNSAMAPSQIHFTLYQSADMRGLDLNPGLLVPMKQNIAKPIAQDLNMMFSLDTMRVHGDQYLMWHARVAMTVQRMHVAAMILLSPFVSDEQKQRMVDLVKARNPSIRPRDLGLVRECALEWVRWRNVPHLQCAFAQPSLPALQPRTRYEHRGIFTALELTSHGPNGRLKETIYRIPIE